MLPLTSVNGLKINKNKGLQPKLLMWLKPVIQPSLFRQLKLTAIDSTPKY